MGGDSIGNALAAAQPGADELVGVGPVDLGTGRTLGGAASLARDGQDAAGFVDGVVAVEQSAGGAVDVIDAATQQDWLQASSGVAGGACGDVVGGQRRYSSRRALTGGMDERRRAPAGRRGIGFVDQRCCAAFGLARVACRSGRVSFGVGTVTGHPVNSPARHFTVIPHHGRGLFAWVLPVTRVYPHLVSLTRIKSIIRIIWRRPAVRRGRVARLMAGHAW
jgi:hypothetical protein